MRRRIQFVVFLRMDAQKWPFGCGNWRAGVLKPYVVMCFLGVEVLEIAIAL